MVAATPNMIVTCCSIACEDAPAALQNHDLRRLVMETGGVTSSPSLRLVVVRFFCRLPCFGLIYVVLHSLCVCLLCCLRHLGGTAVLVGIVLLGFCALLGGAARQGGGAADWRGTAA